MSENPPTGGEILRDAGYSPATARNPGEILNSTGVQEELTNIGFDEETAKQVVGMILRDTEEEGQTRLKAADMVFKSFGTYAPEKHVNLNLDASVNERTKELAAKLIGLHGRGSKPGI